MSHPTMGAWIEIVIMNILTSIIKGRTPRWVRGLKSSNFTLSLAIIKSHPTMGAWIEIYPTILQKIKRQSHPTMGAWIEIVFDFGTK